MKYKSSSKIIFILLLAVLNTPLFSLDKKALVIGNSSYKFFAPLTTPGKEAKQMASSLKRLGFEVNILLDSSLEKMLEALYDLEKSANNGDLCLFHYGGHGVQSGGENFLIPVDADISDERKLRTRALNLNEVMSSLEISGSSTNIVIIDACRDNPIPGLTRSGARGLAVTANPPGNSIIIYSAQAGSTAEDGVFTPTLLKYLEEPIRLADILIKVQKEVQQKTNRRQRPGSYSELTETVYLKDVKNTQKTVAGEKKKIKDGFIKINSAWFDFYSPIDIWKEDKGYDYKDPENIHSTWLASFYVSPYEVTFQEYDEFCNAEGWPLPDDKGWGRGSRPVMHVSFSDVIAYANWASSKAGLDPCYKKEGEDFFCDFSKNGYRLPTIAEWQYIAREGGKNISMPWGSGKPYGNLPDQSLKSLVRDKEYLKFKGEGPYIYSQIKIKDNYNDKYKYTAPVGSFKPNSLGIYDLEGNVTEYCWDIRWDDYGYDWDKKKYKDELFIERNPTGPEAKNGNWRSRRGSSWAFMFKINECYYQNMWTNKASFSDVGFRLVRNAIE